MLPHELVARYISPYLKALVALELSEKGLSQVKIARILGISQAMVNNYLSKPREYYITQLEKSGLSREDVEKYVYSLVALHNSYQDFIYTFTSILNEILATRKLCKLHVRITPGVDENCSICNELFQYKLRDPHIRLVEKLVERIVGHPKAVELVPEVGSNIVYAPPRAQSVQELIAVPGRIVKVRDRAVPVGKPSYGGSRFLASLLLEARSKEPRISCVVNIKYKREYVEGLRRKGYSIVEVGPSSNPREQYVKVVEAIRKTPGVKKVVVDLGAIGLEPTIYVFHEDPVALVNDVLGLLEELG